MLLRLGSTTGAEVMEPEVQHGRKGGDPLQNLNL